jgi:phage-related protein
MFRKAVAARKQLIFRGDSLAALQSFPLVIKKVAGRQLDRVQWGREPLDWKPMTAVGAGVNEIRLRDEHGIYRVMYVTKIADSVFVLHCFQKKTQKTATADIDLAARRYKDLLKEFPK